MELIETITVRNLPAEFSATYEAPGMTNEVKTSFVAITPHQTRFVTEQTHHFRGGMKLIGALMPGMFRKQAKTYLERFKTLAESLPVS